MGKNQKKNKNKNKAKKENNDKKENIEISINDSPTQKLENSYEENFPFVSIITPTFNRRPFIKSMIKCFELQDYPKDRIEWIIIDDGTDKIEDLVKDVPQIKYFYYEDKMPLGRKRNLCHKKSKGEILVYMDDDDYYPSDRISHAVKTLQDNPNHLICGSSEIFIYFKHNEKIYKFGPYGENHATAGTFAFRRKLLDDHKYEYEAALAEEKAFLDDYKVPLKQLDPKKVILVFSHQHNTFDKRKLLENPNPKIVQETDYKVSDFIKDDELRKFYMEDIDNLLENYEPGRPIMKPDVLEQMVKIEEKRRKHAEQMAQQQMAQNSNKIVIQNPGQPPMVLDNQKILEILKQQQEMLKQKDTEIVNMKKQLELNKTLINKLVSKINEAKLSIQ